MASIAAATLIQFTATAGTWQVNVDDYLLYADPNPPQNQLKLGGLSGLVAVPGDGSGTLYYAVTDRGPNGDDPAGTTAKYFPVPSFNPSILTIQLLGNGSAEIVDILPLRKPDGNPVTGLPNGVPGQCATPTELPLDLCNQILPIDPDGLDTEGLAIDQDGNFWVCDEYRPSVAKVAPDGTVLLRLVPQGTICGGEIIPTMDILPAVYAKRRINRGLEGITVTPNNRLYTVIQRPLENPNVATGNDSRNLRVLELDLATFAIRQFVYRTEDAPAGFRQRDVYASDLSSFAPFMLAVFERKTDKVFAANIAPATDITPLENADGTIGTTGKRLEQLSGAELSAAHIKTVKKAVAASGFRHIDANLEKIEGLAIVGRTAFICNDNDFNLAGVNLSTLDPVDCDPPAAIIQPNPANTPRILSTPIVEELIFDESD